MLATRAIRDGAHRLALTPAVSLVLALALAWAAFLIPRPAAAAATAAPVPAAAPAAPGLPVPLSVQDDEGHLLRLTGPARRIVSLSVGATALLFAAGAGADVVGTVAYSTEPAAAEHIPRVGDAETFDVEGILALHPDLVVAWSSGTPAARIETLQRLGLAVYRQRVTRLDDLPAAIRHFGVLAGTQTVAEAAARSLQRRIAHIRALHDAKDAASPSRSVFVELWNRPLYTVGRSQLLSDAVEACGYHNLFADLADAAPPVGLESVLARNPGLILALPDEPRTGAQWLADWRRYPSLAAVQNGRLVAFSDPRLTRLGPGAVDALVNLCRALDAAGHGPA